MLVGAKAEVPATVDTTFRLAPDTKLRNVVGTKEAAVNTPVVVADKSSFKPPTAAILVALVVAQTASTQNFLNCDAASSVSAAAVSAVKAKPDSYLAIAIGENALNTWPASWLIEPTFVAYNVYFIVGATLPAVNFKPAGANVITSVDGLPVTDGAPVIWKITKVSVGAPPMATAKLAPVPTAADILPATICVPQVPPTKS